MTRIDEIAARAAAATRGPWKAIDKGNTVPSFAVVTVPADGNKQQMICPNMSPKTANAAFVANARDDIPFLLAEIERLTARAEKAERERDAAVEDMKVVCMAGEPCAVCVNCENRGDQFPCGYGEWCGGEHWKYRGPQEAGKGE